MRFTTLFAVFAVLVSSLAAALPAELQQAAPAQEKCGWGFYRRLPDREVGAGELEGRNTAALVDLWQNDRCFDLEDTVWKINIDNPRCGLCVFFA